MSTAHRDEPWISNSVLDLIGRTPIVRLLRIASPQAAGILAKLEFFNPAGSVKDRIALSMIEDAERRGALGPGSIIVEPTSGNTGIGLAMVAAVKGYRCILTMPESYSSERRFLLRRFGAEVVYTPAEQGMLGAVEKARTITSQTENAFMPQQFQNPANPEVHRQTTAREIIEATGGELAAFVAGVGTGGTITGVGEILKDAIPGIRIIAVEPEGSQVLKGGRPGPHKIEGIGAGFVPEILNRSVIDEIHAVGEDDAFEMSRRLATEEGLLVGISAGAATAVALQVAEELGPDRRLLVILPDTGERYASQEAQFDMRSRARKQALGARGQSKILEESASSEQ